MTDHPLYWAYGSNLWLDQMARRCPAATPVQALTIKGWQLVFRRVADVEPCPGAVVHGALYNVTPDCVDALDRFEGVASGVYRVVDFTVKLPGTDRRVKAFFYRMNREGLEPPSDVYFRRIQRGYAQWRLPRRRLLAAREAAVAAYEQELEAAEAATLEDPAHSLPWDYQGMPAGLDDHAPWAGTA